MKKQFLHFTLLSLCLASSSVKPDQEVEITESVTPPRFLYLLVDKNTGQNIVRKEEKGALWCHDQTLFTEAQFKNYCQVTPVDEGAFALRMDTQGLTGTFTYEKLKYEKLEGDFYYCYKGKAPKSAFSKYP